VIKVNNIIKYFGKTLAVDNVSFEVERGEIVGFLGPNGAGKTTTMRIITGYLYPDKGEVYLENENIFENPVKVKRQIGYMPESTPLYNDMPVFNYLKFFASIRKIEKDGIENHIREILERVGIEEDKYYKTIGTLSKGYRQRVGLAQALIGDPKILILDEPTVGLDPNQIVEIRNLIKEISKDKTIILSTHILQEVSAICNRVLIINEGKLIASDTIDGLLQKVENVQRIKIIFEGNLESIKDRIKTIDGVTDLEVLSVNNNLNEILVVADKSKDVRRELANLIVNFGYSLYELSRVVLSLEEVFSKLTKE